MNGFIAAYSQNGADWIAALNLAARYTILISMAAFALAIPLAVVLMLGRVSRNPILRRVAGAVIETARGIPTLAWLFLLYFVLPEVGIVLDEFAVSILCLGLIGGAYLSEVLRGGFVAIHRGQREAAAAVGLSPGGTLRFIIMPQVARIILPPSLNVLVSLLKESSVCALISTPELMLRAKDLATNDFRPLQVYLLVGLYYFALGWPLSLLVRLLDHRLKRSRPAPT
jgi:His/Glu/Gln/Arg/opine family amino acid ABC transporter permease subunit